MRSLPVSTHHAAQGALIVELGLIIAPQKT